MAASAISTLGQTSRNSPGAQHTVVEVFSLNPMGEHVHYSSVKFKKNSRQETAETETHEDVTYSEVKTMNPSSSNTVCGDSAEKSGQSSHPYRLAAVCLGLLCVLLLAATLVLCVLYTSMSENFSMLKRDLEELRVNSSTMSNERDQQQRDYNTLKQENERLLRDYNNLKQKNDQQERDYNNLKQEKDQLQRASDPLKQENGQLLPDNIRLKQEKDQLLKDYNQLLRGYRAVLKKFPLIEQYCSPNIVCKPCPQGWKQFSSKCYYFSTERKSWMDSRIDCIKRGADLVVIKSEEEQEFITKHTGAYWIGLTYPGTRHSWLWVDETYLQTGFWSRGQPDYGEGYEYCVVTGYYNWSDESCNLDMKFACMTEALPS